MVIRNIGLFILIYFFVCMLLCVFVVIQSLPRPPYGLPCCGRVCPRIHHTFSYCIIMYALFSYLMVLSLYCAKIGSTQARSSVHSLPLVVVAVALKPMTCLSMMVCVLFTPAKRCLNEQALSVVWSLVPTSRMK